MIVNRRDTSEQDWPASAAGQQTARSSEFGPAMVPLALNGALFVAVLAPPRLLKAAVVAGVTFVTARWAKHWAETQSASELASSQSSPGAAELEALLAASSEKPPAYRERHPMQRDEVDEASMESFPASDPPAATGAVAAPTGNQRQRE
jgi:hypothetical protein